MTSIPEYRIDDPAAWTAAELAADRSWIHELTPAELAELDQAAQHAAASGHRLFEFDRDDFPLPTLGPRFARIAQDLEHGRGCALIRGLDVSRSDCAHGPREGPGSREREVPVLGHRSAPG